MKKLLAILLALGLVLVSFAALADGEVEIPMPNDGDIEYDTSDASGVTPTASTPTITKEYTIANDDTLKFKETLAFTVSCTDKPSSVTTAPLITIGTNNTYEYKVGTDPTDNIPITFPTYTVAGTYTYEVKETAGTVQGTTTYFTGTIYVKVYVVYQKVSGVLQLVPTANVWGVNNTTETDNTKTDKMTNVFEVGTLKVSKAIDGNLADPDKQFTIKVKFTKESSKTVMTPITYVEGSTTKTITAEALNATDGAEAQIKLKGGESVTFTNIPYGVSYAIEESGITNVTDEADQIAKANNVDAYQITYDDYKSGKIGSENSAPETEVQNYKNIPVNTGITLDFVPYVTILALAGIALVALKARKKEY